MSLAIRRSSVGEISRPACSGTVVIRHPSGETVHVNRSGGSERSQACREWPPPLLVSVLEPARSEAWHSTAGCGGPLAHLARRRTRRTLARSVRVAASAWLLGIAGCHLLPSSPPAQDTPAARPATAPAAAAATQAAEQLAALLDAAEQALREDRLTTPAAASAYRYFADALAIDPDHPEARQGLERIVERYLELAEGTMERQGWERARTLLDRAASVDAEHPGIAPRRRQLELLAAAERRALALDRAALRARQDALAERLRAFGGDARRPGARVRIRAPSDAEARWIYGQLSRAAGEGRIRATIDVGLPPQVELLLLPSPAGQG